MVWRYLLCAGVPDVGVGWAPLTTRRAGTVGRQFPGPHVGRILASHGGTLIWVLAVILYANVIPELHAFGTALLAGASVASVLVGLAAQSTLGNMIAGLSLLMYRPFQIGDSVQLTVPAGVQTGKIEDLTLGYTVIKTQENNEIVVPTSVMASQAIIKSA